MSDVKKMMKTYTQEKYKHKRKQSIKNRTINLIDERNKRTGEGKQKKTPTLGDDSAI